MSSQYTIKEVRVSLASGAEIIAEVSSVKGVAALLADLSKEKLEAARRDAVKETPAEKTSDETKGQADSPESRIETKADLKAGSLAKKKVVAFKDDVPQLLRPNAFGATTDAALALIFAFETGLQRSSIEYEAFKGLFESQNIKSGSPLRVILSNLRQAGYLNKTKYNADKSISLTAKGETKAVEILSEQCAA